MTAIAAGAFHILALVPNDTTPPAISADIIGTLGSGGWYTSDMIVSWSVVDDESPRSTQPGCDATTIDSDTAGTPLTCAATSAGGTSSASVTIKRDATPPSTSASVVSGTTQVTVTLAAGDTLSGLAATSYRVNGGALQAYSGPISFTTSGAYTIGYFSADQAGNVEATKTLTFSVNAAPTAGDDSYMTSEDIPLGSSHAGRAGQRRRPRHCRRTCGRAAQSPQPRDRVHAQGRWLVQLYARCRVQWCRQLHLQACDDYGAASAPSTVTLAITPVNDVPAFVAGPNVTVAAHAGPYSAAWATGITPRSAGESGQALTFALTNNNTTLFSRQPALAPDGTLTFTPAPNRSGSATVTVVLKDNGGISNGGVDHAPAQTFTITIIPVNGAQPPGYQVYFPLVTR